MDLTLYKISDEIADILASEEWTDETESALESINMALEQKVSNITHFLDDLNAFADRCKAEEKRISERRKSIESRVSSLKAYVTRCMQESQRTEIEVGTRKVSLQKNPPSLIVDDEKLIPARFIDFIPATTKINNASLKDAIKNGEVIEGAHLEQGVSLRVR